MRRWGRAVGAVAATGGVVALLAGCGGGSSGQLGKHHQASSSQSLPSEPLPSIDVPSVYDNAKGWAASLGWVPQGTDNLPVAVASKSDLVGYLDAASNGYTLRVRDAASGTVRFSGKVWQGPAPTQTDLSDGQVPDIPQITTVVEGGREYFAVWMHGNSGGDQLTKAQEVIQLAIYPADSSGDGVPPSQLVSIPAQDAQDVKVTDGGLGLLITWGQVGMTMNHAAAVDPATGKVTRFGDAVEDLFPGCALCEDSQVRALTPQGPVIDGIDMNGGDAKFELLHGWQDSQIAPSNVDASSGRSITAVGDHLVTTWRPNSGGNSTTWALNDARTGQVEATVTCPNAAVDETPGKGDVQTAVASPNGRYVVSYQVAFDLTRKSGACFGETSQRKPVQLTSVDNDGTAYGTVSSASDGSSATTAVSAPLASDSQPQVLPFGTQIPLAVLPHAAVFLASRSVPEVTVLRRR